MADLFTGYKFGDVSIKAKDGCIFIKDEDDTTVCLDADQAEAVAEAIYHLLPIIDPVEGEDE